MRLVQRLLAANIELVVFEPGFPGVNLQLREGSFAL